MKLAPVEDGGNLGSAPPCSWWPEDVRQARREETNAYQAVETNEAKW
jgi:hypothetical protein